MSHTRAQVLAILRRAGLKASTGRAPHRAGFEVQVYPDRVTTPWHETALDVDAVVDRILAALSAAGVEHRRVGPHRGVKSGVVLLNERSRLKTR